MKKHNHSHVNYCPMSKVNDLGQTRVKSCPGKSIRKCEQECVEADCAITSTDIICDNYECQITKQLDEYKTSLEDSKTEIAKLKAQNTQFRVIMFMPTQAESFIKKGEIDFSGIKGLINRQRQSWDTCDDTTILYMLEYHQKFAEAYSQFAHERNSKIKIKELIVEKSKQETRAIVKKLDDDKAVEAAKKAKLTKFGKALAGYVKIGMSEDKARALLLGMGLKDDGSM